jgi:PiT family inorganic phosphate transporter
VGARILAHDFTLRAGLVVVGCYGAYALGANNVANVTGVFAGAGMLSPMGAAVLGGASIALGLATFGRNVMTTVGRGIAHLNAYGAFVVVLSGAVTVHFYALVGVPVSSSQAVVGAALGVGLLHGAETVRPRALLGILAGWIATPVIAGLFAVLLHFLTHLRFVQ